MNLTTLATMTLAAGAAGGVAYVVFYPWLSGEARAAKRQKALVGAKPDRRVDRLSTVNRRDHVAQSLKDLEKRERDRNKVTIEGRIAQAGLSWTRGRFWVISAGLAAVTALLLFVGTGEPIAGLAGLFIGGLGMPRWVLGYLKKRRINRYLEELPNAMDVIVRGIRSGLPLNDCLRIVASEAQEPVRTEFRHIVEQQALGISVAEAVLKLYERVPVPESNFFAIVINIQSKAGGNLSETLANLSRVLRERKKMKGKVAAMSQEAKASAAIIAALPFVVALLTWLTSPKYIELLWLTTPGKIALCLCACWMSIGVAIMRKMINFDF